MDKYCYSLKKYLSNIDSVLFTIIIGRNILKIKLKDFLEENLRKGPLEPTHNEEEV